MTDRTATVVRVCAAGHPLITYVITRATPEPCPICAAKKEAVK